MPAIKKINNKNPNVEAKVNYFIDRFIHCVAYLGSEWDLDLENQLSLIDKVSFYIENNEFRVDYYENYFSHELFSNEDIWKEYPAFARLKPFLLELRGAKPRAFKESVIRDNSFHEAVLQLSKELRAGMPEILFKSLMSIINCSYTLNEHNHINKLNLLAKLIVSEGFFSGKKRIEISELINRIFNKDLKRFPVPIEVKRKDEKKYVNSNNLVNQLSGFKTIMQDKKESSSVLMKIYGGHNFPDNFYFHYCGIRFYGKMHPRVLKLHSTTENHRCQDFFSKENYLLVLAKIDYFSAESIVSRMSEATKEQIDYISTSLARSLNLDDTPNYILLDYKWKIKGFSISSQKHSSFYEFNQLKALNNNPFSILKAVKASPAKDKLLSCENLYVQAHKNEKVALYWQYLEALLPLDKNGKKQIRYLLPNLLLLTEKEIIDHRILSTLLNSINFINGGIELLGIEIGDLPKVRNELVKGRIPKEVRRVDYAFLQELVKQYDLSLDKAYFENAQRFYLQILKETYGNRNFDVHAGIQSEKSNMKIKRCVPRMISRLRWVIFDEIKAYPNADFDTVIQNLIIRSNKLLS